MASASKVEVEVGYLSPTPELGAQVRALPAEAREIIYTFVLEIGPGPEVPPFLLACAREVKDSKIYMEVHTIY